jgi:ATP-dependent helicase Lhr and Lhr-like helicase
MKNNEQNIDILSLFHPVITRWFRERIGEPTDVQAQSWQHISHNEHVLITAPTGSGKTLAAFLWAINQLVGGQIGTGYTSTLYISPLKALNNDIQRNLLRPLQEIKEQFLKAGLDFPEIAVETRSGDTPQSERARMQRHPPEILITTPESLNLLVSSTGGRATLKNLSSVILDEIHAVLGTKRGVYLMTAVERLVPLAGEFQRISLSATIRAPELAAGFVGGYTLTGDGQNPDYLSRPVSIVNSQIRRRYDIKVQFPVSGIPEKKESTWESLTADFKKIIEKNRSTLLFANGRRLCEKLALMINENEDTPVAYVHHGSLSREIRTEVEHRLRDGELKAVVATNSLELGIDIGDLDEVVLIQPPPSISAAIQRVGRAGHQVGQICKGTIFPVSPHDLMEAAVLAPLIINQDMETIKPVEGPLDVLAQVITAMVGVEKWDIDRLYAQVRTCYSYRNLSREQFDLVLNMLAGRYADSHIRDLKPQISIDRLDNTVVAKKGALLTVYTSGGVIPDRGYFHLRHQETGALIGELDEEFVWEARLGQTFALGAQNWRIERITHNDVFVLPGNPDVMAAPFWKGEENYRDFHFSDLIGRFLEFANDRLEDKDFIETLERDYLMDQAAAVGLITFLSSQKEATGSDLPHRHHIVVEMVESDNGGTPGTQMILHTVWGNQLNRPFAMALDAAWEDKYGQRLEIYTSNDCIVFQLPSEVRPDDVLSLVSTANVETLLRKRLETSGFFGARFRECAGRALLLPRSRVNRRMPLWMNRLRSQKLLSTMFRYEDFPILLETWRTCLVDEFDMVGLKQVLSELESGVIRWSAVRTKSPSPLAQHLTWRQTNEYMYMTDELQVSATSSLRDDLIRHVVLSPSLRPAVSPELVAQFLEKRQRLAPGYSPENPRDLVDWVKERILIPESEWQALLQAIHRDHGHNPEKLLETIAGKLVKIKLPAASGPLIVSLEDLDRISFTISETGNVPVLPILSSLKIPSLRKTDKAFEVDRDEVLIELLEQWLQFYGPTTQKFVSDVLGISRNELSLAIEDLIDSQKVITGQLITGKIEEYICDSENYEILLRQARRAAVPAFDAREIKWLPLFLAQYHALGNLEGDVDRLFHCLEHLRCLPLTAELWESEILPARIQSYNQSWLDTVMQESDLRWIGGEKHTAALCFAEDLPLFQSETDSPENDGQSPQPAAGSLFPDTLGHYDFSTLMRTTGLSPAELSNRLWEGVWQGRISNDTFTALRKGIMTRFEAPRLTPSGSSGRRPGRTGFSRWKASLPFAGNWFLLPPPEPADDLLEREEQLKDRVRLLLDRYGLLFRELLEHESSPFRWSKIFRALRLMELSGEVLSGYFFKDIPSPQFIAPRAFQSLQGRIPENRIYWFNAVDPVSLCGVQIETLKKEFPRRIPGNHLVYHGTRLVVTSQQNGRLLTISVPPDDARLTEYLGFLRHLLSRQFQPVRRITIETINDEPAPESPYISALKVSFDVITQNNTLVLYRKMSEAAN